METLVKKFKGAVDDDRLLRLGEIEVICPTAMFVVTSDAQDYNARIIDGGVFVSNNQKEITASSAIAYALSARSRVALAVDYRIRQLRYVIADETLRFQDSLAFFEGGYDGNLEAIKGLTNLYYLNLSAFADVLSVGNISLLKDMPLQELYLRDQYKIYGDFDGIGDNILLEKVNLWGAGYENGLITGNIEDYVAKQRTAGRTSGNLLICIFGIEGGLSFNGVVMTCDSATNYKALSWTPNTITWDGTTINA